MIYDNEGKVAMWLNDGPKGKFLSGKLTIKGVTYEITLNKNHKKNTEKSPDYYGYVKAPGGGQDEPDNSTPF